MNWDPCPHQFFNAICKVCLLIEINHILVQLYEDVMYYHTIFLDYPILTIIEITGI
jgi:hypothetical protein